MENEQPICEKVIFYEKIAFTSEIVVGTILIVTILKGLLIEITSFLLIVDNA